MRVTVADHTPNEPADVVCEVIRSRVLIIGIRVLIIGIRVLIIRIRVLIIGIRVLKIGIRVLIIGIRVLIIGIRVQHARRQVHALELLGAVRADAERRTLFRVSSTLVRL